MSAPWTISSGPFPTWLTPSTMRIALAMWDNMGRVVAETMLLDRILKQPERMEIVNRDHVTSLMAQPRPQIGVDAAYGELGVRRLGLCCLWRQACGCVPSARKSPCRPHAASTSREPLFGWPLHQWHGARQESGGSKDRTADDRFRPARREFGFRHRPGRSPRHCHSYFRRRGQIHPRTGHDCPPCRRADMDGAGATDRPGNAVSYRAEGARGEAHQEIAKRTFMPPPPPFSGSSNFGSAKRPSNGSGSIRVFENANLIEGHQPLDDASDSVASISASLVNQTIHYGKGTT